MIVIKDNSQKFMAELNASIQDKLVKSALVVERDAKQARSGGHGAPRQTGNLSRSINSVIEKDRAIIGTNCEYAPFVELGSVHQQAQSFLRPALQYFQSIFESIWGKK